LQSAFSWLRARVKMVAFYWEFSLGVVLVLGLHLVNCFLVFPRQGSFGVSIVREPLGKELNYL